MHKIGAFAAGLALVAMPASGQEAGGYLYNDSHFHLTNYLQRGLTAREYVQMMAGTVKRSTLFGIPLQQTWYQPNSGDFAPTYYLHADSSLYYYSFTDAVIASEFLLLPKDQQARLDPMITGFNPADMYAVDHIRRVLTTYPGVFTGIGEFSIHKEFVSSKVAGETASLLNPALDRILEFSGESGLVVILHCDIDVPFARGNALPIYFTQMRDLLLRHPDTTIIWAHTGLGRVVSPEPLQATGPTGERPPNHMELVEQLLGDPRLPNLYFDISWDEVAKYAVATPETQARAAALFDKYPDRFLFGTDVVAPPNIEAGTRVFHMWDGIFAQVRPETRHAIAFGNYERLFDAGRAKVRAWERANVPT